MIDLGDPGIMFLHENPKFTDSNSAEVYGIFET
jgi:hypothetical protein